MRELESKVEVRVRFAPSPTGNLHVGGVRTALFNWLFARHEGGKFILRIDDTDPERSKKEYLDNILEAMKWLGLDWDEGPEVGGPYAPYFESQRMDRYRAALDGLLSSGDAFKCWCTEADIDEMRRQAAIQKKPPRYNGRCLNLSASERAKLEAGERKPVIRFRLPDGPPVVLDDVIRGKIEFPRDMLDHFVIARSDGKPVYNFTTVLDEVDLHITHVVRGDDHLSNTPKQMLMAGALGFNPPRYAHLPQILGMDKARLSKRHGAAAVIDLREDGFLPGAVLNFLALLGWSFNEKDELFTLGELVEKFSLERVGTAPAVFNAEKLEWMNGVYIRKMPVEKLEADLAARLKAAFAGNEDYDQGLVGDAAYAGKVIGLLKDGLKALAEVADQADFFYRKEVKWEDDAKVKLASWPKAWEIMKAVLALAEKTEPFTPEALEAAWRTGASSAGLKFKDFVHPTRFALTGRSAGPSLFHLMQVLGRQTSISRLRSALSQMNT